MSLRINDYAPDFSATTTHGKIDFHEWSGDSWVILPTLANIDAEKLFPGGWKTVKPYLRIVAQPD